MCGPGDAPGARDIGDDPIVGRRGRRARPGRPWPHTRTPSLVHPSETSRVTIPKAHGPQEPKEDRRMALRRTTRCAIAAVALLALAAGAALAQFGRGYGRSRYPPRIRAADQHDAGFSFCRLMYASEYTGRGMGRWSTDYPFADRESAAAVGVSHRRPSASALPVPDDVQHLGSPADRQHRLLAPLGRRDLRAGRR